MSHSGLILELCPNSDNLIAYSLGPNLLVKLQY